MSKKSEELLDNILKEIRVLNAGITLNTQAINDLYNKNDDLRLELVAIKNSINLMNSNLINYKSSEKEALDTFNQTLKSQRDFLKSYENQINILNQLLQSKAEKEKMESLSTLLQILNNVELLRDGINWDTKWASLQEKDKMVDILAKSSEAITKKILKLAPNISGS